MSLMKLHTLMGHPFILFQEIPKDYVSAEEEALVSYINYSLKGDPDLAHILPFSMYSDEQHSTIPHPCQPTFTIKQIQPNPY